MGFFEVRFRGYGVGLRFRLSGVKELRLKGLLGLKVQVKRAMELVSLIYWVI